MSEEINVEKKQIVEEQKAQDSEDETREKEMAGGKDEVAAVIDKDMRGSKAEWKRETKEERYAREDKEKLESWVPRTKLGKEVRAGKIKNIDEILDKRRKILEPEVVDLLLDLKNDLLNIGQSKGKFGGGKRRAWKQTQKKTKEGNIAKFSVLAVVGNGKGYVGIGSGKAKETLPAKDKAIRKAKLNIQKIELGCGSYDCSCDGDHSILASVVGKCAGVSVKLIPAPQGTGLVASDELKRILKAVGIKDVYSQTFGPTSSTINAGKACMDALTKLNGIEK